MRPNRRRKTTEAVVLSVAAHAAILVVLALHAPRLRIPPPERGPPEAVIPILIMPRTPPPSAAAGSRPAPSPIRLHQRVLRNLDEDAPIPPLVTPVAPPAPPAPAPTPRAVPAPPPDPVAVDASRALKGLVGCANPSLLSREEREKCENAFAAGARDAPFTGLGIERGKAAGLAAAGARRDADFRYKRLEGTPAPRNGQLPWDTQRSPPDGRSNLGLGASSTDLGATPLKVPF